MSLPLQLPLNLLDLTLLIQLTEQELNRLQQNFELTGNEDDLEMALLHQNTAAKLQGLYESSFSEGCNYPRYAQLIESLMQSEGKISKSNHDDNKKY